jgi:hypothetical protein
MLDVSVRTIGTKELKRRKGITMNRHQTIFALVIATVVLTAVIAVLASPIAQADESQRPTAPVRTETFEFDVAEDNTGFALDTSGAYAYDQPTLGGAFTTHGYIYPAGTLDGSNGVLPSGEPEFPDLVIGEWTRQSYFAGEMITRQMYDFGDEFGNIGLVTEGYEVANLEGVMERVITGGAGPYRNARGEGTQELVGYNATGGANLRLALEVKTQ